MLLNERSRDLGGVRGECKLSVSHSGAVWLLRDDRAGHLLLTRASHTLPIP